MIHPSIFHLGAKLLGRLKLLKIRIHYDMLSSNFGSQIGAMVVEVKNKSKQLAQKVLEFRAHSSVG